MSQYAVFYKWLYYLHYHYPYNFHYDIFNEIKIRLALSNQIPPSPQHTHTHTELWNIGIWHFDKHRSFQSQIDKKLLNLILKIIIEVQMCFKDLCYLSEIFYFEKFDRLSNFVYFENRKILFFLKQIRI